TSLIVWAVKSSGRVRLNEPRNDLASGVRELATMTASLIESLLCVSERWFGGASRPPCDQIAATDMISTRYFGDASRASMVARAGVLAGSTQASQAACMSA